MGSRTTPAPLEEKAFLLFQVFVANRGPGLKSLQYSEEAGNGF